MNLRILAIAALLVAALAVAACGDDGATATDSTVPGPAVDKRSTLFDQALWPPPDEAGAQASPRDVALSFVEDFIGVDKPILGDFQQGDSRSGEVPVYRRGENGASTGRVVATIALRQLEGPRWFVIAAFSKEVEVDRPALSDEITSPVTISGAGVGHEGNVVLRVHQAFRPKPLVEKPVIAGTTERAPFSAELEFELPQLGGAAIVARAALPLPGADAFAAFPVVFAEE